MKSFQFAVQIALILVAIIALAHAQTPFPPGQSCITIPVSSGQWSEVYTLRPLPLGSEVVIKQTHPAGSFDPDIYVRWNSAPTRNDYDYADLTTNPEASVTVPITDERRATATDTLYIGVYSYAGTGSVEVCYQNYQCPNRDCGAAEQAGICDAKTRECTCNPGWTGPGDCSMKEQTSAFGTTSQVSIAPRKPQLIKFSATELTGEMHFQVERPSSVHSDVVIRARRGQIPWSSEFDFEERIAGFTDNASIVIDTHAYAPGDWYVTLETTSTTSSAFTVSITGLHYFCPNNCSAHGTCVKEADVHTCKCTDGYTLSDCSYFGQLLRVNATLPVSLAPFATTGLKFDISQHIEDLNVELQFRFKADKECAPNCPRIYIQRSTSQSTRATENRYIATSKLPITQSQSISVADGDLETSAYTVSIVNPHSTAVTGTAEIHFTPHCPKNCSGHGHCSWDGLCQCHPGFYSSDCSVTKEVCAKRLPSSSGMGKFGLFLTIVIALALGALGGVMFFKKASKNHNSGSAGPSNQQSLNADDQYSQLT